MYSIFQKLNCDLWNTNTQLFSLNFCLFPETCYILLFINKIFNSDCKKKDLSARLSGTAYRPNPENTYIILHPLLFYTSDMYIHSSCTYSTTQFSPFLQARGIQDSFYNFQNWAWSCTLLDQWQSSCWPTSAFTQLTLLHHCLSGAFLPPEPRLAEFSSRARNSSPGLLGKLLTVQSILEFSYRIQI